MNDVTHQKVTDWRNWLLYCGTCRCQWMWVYFYKLASYLRESFLESVHVKRNTNFYPIEAQVEEVRHLSLWAKEGAPGKGLPYQYFQSVPLVSAHSTPSHLG